MPDGLDESFLTSSTRLDDENDDLDLGALQPLTRTPVGITILTRLKALLIPEYFRHRRGGPTARLRSTAYLDGLRGICALMVVLYHYHHKSHHDAPFRAEHGFGYKGDYNFVNLPFVRFLYAGGPGAVGTFFVVSGYVLSRKALFLIHARDAEIYPHLASSIFRRTARLYLPVVAVTSISAMFWHWVYPKGFGSPDLLPELRTLTYWFLQVLDPFGGRNDFKNLPDYNGPMWTVPIELMGSMIVFALLMAFSRLTITARLCCNLSVFLYFFLLRGRWTNACFVAGMMLCEVDMVRLDAAVVVSRPLAFVVKKLQNPSRVVVYLVLLLALQLVSIPTAEGGYGDSAYVFPWAMRVPIFYRGGKEDFTRIWGTLGSAMLVWSLSHAATIRRLLSQGLCQYLGRHSYSLYLIHHGTFFPLVPRLFGIFGRPIFDQPKFPKTDHLLALPNWGPYALEVNYVVPMVIALVINFYVAELVTRTIDVPSADFARWLYDAMQVAW